VDASGCYHIVEEAVFRVQGTCPNIESSLKKEQNICRESAINK
jgi:hypothetical protein